MNKARLVPEPTKSTLLDTGGAHEIKKQFTNNEFKERLPTLLECGYRDWIQHHIYGAVEKGG
jgi:hypothetical protein